MKILLILASILILSFLGVQESFAEDNWKEVLVVDKLGSYIDGQERTYKIPYIISEGNLDKIETKGSFEIFLSDINKESIFEINIPRNYPVTNLIGFDRGDNFSVLVNGEETLDYNKKKIACYYEISIPLLANFEHVQIDWGHIPSGNHHWIGEPVSEDCIKKTIVIPPESLESSTSGSISGKYVFMKDQYGYNIPYEIVNGTLTDVKFDCSSSSMYLEISPKNQGILKFEIPRELMRASVLHGLDDYEFPIWDKKGNFSFYFYKDSKKLGFWGTEILDAHKLETGKPCKPIHNPPYSFLLSPVKQMKNGVETDELICKPNLNLIFKKTDNSSVCVKSTTAEKLIERGWTTIKPSNESQSQKLVWFDVEPTQCLNKYDDERTIWKNENPVPSDSKNPNPYLMDYLEFLSSYFEKNGVTIHDKKYENRWVNNPYCEGCSCGGSFYTYMFQINENQTPIMNELNELDDDKYRPKSEIKDSENYSNLSTKRLVITNLEHTGGTPPPMQCARNLPIFASIDTPEHVLIGDTFDVIFSWSWVIFDEDEEDGIDRIVTEIDPNCTVGGIYFQYPEEMSLLTEVSNKRTDTDWRGHQRSTVTESLEFDNTKINSKTFQFRLTDQIHFPDDNLRFAVGVFSPDLYLTSISDTVSQFSTDRLETTNSTIAREYRESVPHSQGIILENYTSVPNMDNFAEYIKKYIKAENMTQFLLEQNLSVEYIQEFLEKHPELK